MRKLIENRPVVLSLGMAVISFSLFIIYGLNSNVNIFDFLYVNMPIFIIGSVLFMVPVFVHATRNTSKADIIDPELVSGLKKHYVDFDNYEKNPFNMIFSRLYLEIADQRSHATKNLSLGVGFTVIAVILSIFLIVTAQSEYIQKVDTERYLTVFLLPKVAAILFIQTIAMFFLRWYGKNLLRVSDISAQLLCIELKLAAKHMDKENGDFPNKSVVVQSILEVNTERGNSGRVKATLLDKVIDKLSVNISSENKL